MVSNVYNLSEEEMWLSKLVERAANGEEIVIAKSGAPMAKLVPIQSKRERKFGLLKGKVKISKDFDAPLTDELLDLFEK